MFRRLFSALLFSTILLSVVAGRASAIMIASPTYPADLINLTNWYITLPSGAAGAPDTKTSAQLKTFTNEFFKLNTAKDGIVFTAPTNGATTANSSNPRSELREMTNNGATKAAWSTSDGKTHSMFIDQAITAVPTYKPSIVVGQIHNGSDDVIVIRYDGKRTGAAKGLHINGHTGSGNDGVVDIPLDANYQLGTRFTVKFVVEASAPNKTDIYYNGVKMYTLPRSYATAYFKAGAYTQSSCIVTPAEDCNSFGQAVIYNLVVCHDGICSGQEKSTPRCPSDINQDGITNIIDFSILSKYFLKPFADTPRADINTDGTVNILDYSVLARNFLKTCQ